MEGKPLKALYGRYPIKRLSIKALQFSNLGDEQERKPIGPKTAVSVWNKGLAAN